MLTASAATFANGFGWSMGQQAVCYSHFEKGGVQGMFGPPDVLSHSSDHPSPVLYFFSNGAGLS